VKNELMIVMMQARKREPTNRYQRTAESQWQSRRHSNGAHRHGARPWTNRWPGRVCFDRALGGAGLAETVPRK